MKKPRGQVENSQPRNIQRADIAPGDGYALVVDGHFKTHLAKTQLQKKQRPSCLRSIRCCRSNLRRILEVTNLGKVAVISHCSSANQVFSFNLALGLFQEYPLSGRLQRRRPNALDEIFWFRRQRSRPMAVGHELASARTKRRTRSRQHQPACHQDQFNREIA